MPKTQLKKKQTIIVEYFPEASTQDERKRLEQILIEFQVDNNLPHKFVKRPSTFHLVNLFSKPKDICELRLCKKKQVAEPIIVLMLTLYGHELTYGLFKIGSRHDGLAITENMENVMLQMEKDGWTLGAVVTDNADQCGRARRILSLRWPKVAFVICFAHDLNNLVKAALKSDYCEVTKQASDTVNAINASSSEWLVEVHACMESTYGYTLNLQQLCETRRNSMYSCCSTLLRVRSALQLFELKFRTDKDFPRALHVFSRPSLWSAQRDAEEVVRPLAYASLKLQRNANTMADVVVCFLDIFEDIFEGFSRRSYGARNLAREVEKRRFQCEQPLMPLALVLNPAHRQASTKILDKAPLTTLDSLCRIGLHIGCACKKINQEASCQVILVFAVRDTTCERYFSEFALIHSVKPNQMGPEKARKLSLVRKRVRGQEKAETNVKRRKLVDPTERTLLRDRDDHFESCEPESENLHTTVEGPDRAMEYWATILSELEPDDDLENSLGECGEKMLQQLQQKARQFSFQVQQIKEQSVEPTTVPVQRPFPTYNDSSFPQEKTLIGLRGQKVSLADLSVTSVYCNDPRNVRNAEL
ncbi:hypothetical protein PHMEG_00019998 [Phytophthora megakarya]|uniref:DUF659 domain-containing protein n=1 Tax=Phytophthora megakarya TaxID=4795 RepID=A0A225VQJ5_9STRA|nr:hypothetical protein PHMEG_00019998 [Phytophthora megakarya]